MRKAVQKRVAETSLRYAADEIGFLNHTTLDDFANERTKRIHPGTRDLLTNWYFYKIGVPPVVTAEEVTAAIATLRAHWNDPSKSQAIRERRKRDVLDRITADTKE